ncbi:Hpt domain-containing protein [Kocuria sp. M1R5S2]|uniref:Hpt domain-containing protein n=1 Tax=Kocuria rhizosphaerae TaxID=3376285 RepID=UPI0037A14BE5
MSTRARRAGNAEARAALAQIWARHRDDILEHVAVLEDAVAALMEDGLSGAARREAERRAHRLAGSAGTFGFSRASESALRLEAVFAGTDAVAPHEARTAAEDVAALRICMEDATQLSDGSPVTGTDRRG